MTRAGAADPRLPVWLAQGATFGPEDRPDQPYRYWLHRRWHDHRPLVAFCMLNPSTADASIEDPTVRRCLGFARRWGAGALVVVNLFALRSTDPKALYSVGDPVGPQNDDYLVQALRTAETFVCAWGKHGALGDRACAVHRLYRRRDVNTLKPARIVALRLNGDGSPEHPLYVPYDVEPVELAGRACAICQEVHP